MSTSKAARVSNERLGIENEMAPADPVQRPASRASRARVSDEQIHSSACGSAIEINYEDECRPAVNPFDQEWAFGSRPGGKVLNLSRAGRGLVAYCNAHVVVLYDYKTHEQRLLLGHRNAVTSMAMDATGSWLVSVDAGASNLEPSCAILWNLRDVSLQRILPGRPPEHGFLLVAMSPDAQLVAAVTAGPRRLVSLWRCDDDAAGSRPDAVLELPPSLGAANAIAFNQDDPGLLMVTCSRNVAFLVWDGGGLQLHEGLLITKCPGKLVDSVYQRGTGNAISVSTKGFVVLWMDPPVYSPNAKVSRKVYCIEKDGLTTITEVDGMVVIGTARGHVRFYDQDMCLLHWYQQAAGDAIASLSFSVEPSVKAATATASSSGSRTSFPARRSVDVERRGAQQRLDLSLLISGPLPRGYDGGHEGGHDGGHDGGPALQAFQARDLIVSTAAGRMALVSFSGQRSVLLQDVQAAITVIQTHTSKAQLLIGRANGSISLIDYVTKEVMLTHTFECKPGAEPVAVTSLQYSPNGAVLACGRANGVLCLLHPVLLHPVQAQPFHKTRHAIRHLCFSPDNMFMAHCDAANFVSAYRCHNVAKGRWIYLGKQQLHGLGVRCVLFGAQPFDAPLFSLGEDLLLVEYDVAHSLNNTLLVHRMDRVEQSGVPTHMTWCPGRRESDDLTLLMTTSEFKYKLVDLKSRSLCGTYQGPRLRAPVGAIKTIGGASARPPATAVYATQRHMGLQSLPPDGNPFTNLAMIVHPVKIMDFVISSCGEFVFSCGEQDHSVFMWRINAEAVEAIHAEDAEAGLEPWLLSVDGGRGGWLFSAMQDMFCFAQLLHQGTFSTEPRLIGDRLAVCEVPDALRAMGYFPSQFEINTMVREVLRGGEYISSSELVKMLVNYKPSYGVSLDQLRDAFAAFAFPGAGEDLVMSKEKFLSILLDRGEAMDLNEALDVLKILLKGEAPIDAEAEGLYSHLLMDEAARREKLFYFLPETISFSYLVETILGVVKK